MGSQSQVTLRKCLKQHPTFSLSFYYIQQYAYIQVLNMYNTYTEPPFALLT